MENFFLEEDLKVFGIHVKTFPLGIGEAFDDLIRRLPEGLERPYYGISYVTNGNIIYLAVTAEMYEGEAKRYHYHQFSIAKGNYKTITVTDWSKKTDQIKDVFHEMMKEDCPDENRACVEWYISDKEMMCMVRAIDT